MHAVYWIVGAVAAQRLVEMIVAARNTRRLMADGALQVAGDVYPALVVLHIAWLGSILAFVPPDTPPDWRVLAAYVALQGVRYWVMASLGRFWTTRLIAVPHAPVIRTGPYRFVRHPNYLVVVAEIFLLPLVFNAWAICIVFSIVNAALLSQRIRMEERTLAIRSG